MSARKLGGGRILGTGKGLAVGSAPSPPASTSGSRLAASHSVRPSSPHPAASDTSADTPGNLDITSTILEDDAASSSNGQLSSGQPLRLQSQGSTSSSLVCPICEEEMMTLLQLNRHLDDVHQELPAVEQDEVRSWFDKQVLKAKRFQPLSLFAATQKLRGLDVFESNESLPAVSSSSTGPTAPFAATATISRSVDPPSPVDPDDLITRKHWQRSTPNDMCTDPTCGRTLGPLTGSVNCRSCGKLFCEQHTMYQMKLSRAANHEPIRGFWARVCETCYKSRDGYNDHSGVLNDHTAAFVAIRRKKAERQNLEIARLEKRLTKLTRLLANPPPEDTTSRQEEREGKGLVAATLGASAFANGAQNKRKTLEQTVVAWEDDKCVPRCPYCQQEFSWTFRRHHCRICGRVVCSDMQTSCSSEVPLTVAVPPTTEKPGANGSIDLNIRMCRECRHTIFSKQDFLSSVSHKPPDQRAYETLRQFERGIRLLMPTFHKVLAPLQPTEDGTPPATHAQIQEASKIRKRLTDSFTKYDLAARRVRDLPTRGSATQEKLQKNVYQAASAFLHSNMLPLKSLPRMLRPGRPNGSQVKRLVPSSLRHEDSSLSSPAHGDNASVAPSEASTAVSLLEQEERELRERLVVLEEQRFMVESMVKSAQGQRRFEEVGALTRNVEELDVEIEGLRKRVQRVEGRWEDMYATGSVDGLP